MKLEDLEPEPDESPIIDGEIVEDWPDVRLIDPYWDSRLDRKSIVATFGAVNFIYQVDENGVCKRIPVGKTRTPDVWGD